MTATAAVAGTPRAPQSFMVACREYFGMKQGQSPMQFMQETKALTEKDREEIVAGLTKLGFNIQATAPAK